MNAALRNLAPAALVLLSAVLAACGTTVRMPDADQAAIERETEKQFEASLRMRRDLNDKINRVGPKLAQASAPLCGEKVIYGTGLATLNTLVNEKPDTRALRSIYGAGWHVVSYVSADAEKAGLRRGDIIVTANGATLTPNDPGTKTLQRAINEVERNGSPLHLTVRRGTETKDIVIHPKPTCAFPIRLVDSVQINAATDGDKIAITSGMVRFLETDDEMAFLLGHEMAHAIQNHIAKQKANRAVGTVIGLLITVFTGVDATGLGGELATLAVSKDLEHEADVVGLYLAARAGYDVSKIPDFWRRMSAVAPGAMHTQVLGTHPSNVSRALMIEQVVKEIAAKKAAGLPLVPTVASARAAQ